MTEIPEERDESIPKETWNEIQELKDLYPGTARGIYLLALLGLW